MGNKSVWPDSARHFGFLGHDSRDLRHERYLQQYLACDTQRVVFVTHVASFFPFEDGPLLSNVRHLFLQSLHLLNRHFPLRVVEECVNAVHNSSFGRLSPLLRQRVGC